MATANEALLKDSAVTLTAGVQPDSGLADVLAGRADILALTQATHDALLRPRDAGGLGRAERAALACRIALLNDEPALARHYRELLRQTGAAENNLRLADPACQADAVDDRRLAALVRHVDKVTRTPRDATRADIEALKNVGVAEADVVRLSQLIAFVNYQVRVVAGLRLLQDAVGATA